MKRNCNSFCHTLCFLIVLMLIFSGCVSKDQGNIVRLDPQNPTVVSIWHFYNSNAKDIFDELVLEFNETVGLEEGIVIDAYGYGDATSLEEAIYNSANRMIGAEDMPHIFMAYPDGAYRINQLTALIDLDDYFTDEELSQYLPEFLEEGVWDSKAEYKMVPVAKSSEVLYLNKTDWDKFSQATGTSEKLLETWEGLATAAETYYEWSGGKAFLGFNAFSDFQAVTAAQLGNSVYEVNDDGTAMFHYDKNVAKTVWDICYVPHLKGWYSSNVYNQDGIKSGDLIAYIGSSAGSSFFPDMVTISEEQSYAIQSEVLPYPYFEGGTPYIGQRGAGMSILKSDKSHEYAASRFLKWLTEPAQNLKFATSTGYLPVENKALDSMDQILEQLEVQHNKAVEQSITTVYESMKLKQFYVRTAFNGSFETNTLFSNSLFDKINSDLAKIDAQNLTGEARAALISEMMDNSNFELWYNSMTGSISEKLNQYGRSR